MSALALILAQAAAATAPLQPPTDWSALADLPLTRTLPISDALSAFVKEEVTAGRCPQPPRDADGSARLAVDMAVLVDSVGTVRRIVPRAINCPTVEQYAVGVVASFVRGNVMPPGSAEGWFKAHATFSWK